MPDRITPRLYPPWVQRNARFLRWLVLLVGLFLALTRLEDQQDRIEKLKATATESCEQRSKSREAVRTYVYIAYERIHDAEVREGYPSYDLAALGDELLSVFPPLECD
jgi:hypothetical protein